MIFRIYRSMLAALVGGVLVPAVLLQAAGPADSLKPGAPDIKSVGSLAFGPDGVLFVADPQGAAIFAIDTGDKSGTPAPIKVEKIDDKVASLLGTDAKNIAINSVAVNPVSGNAYLSVSRGKGPDAKPVLLRVDAKGKIEEVSLKQVHFAKAELPNAASGTKQEAITGLAFMKGQVVVAGMSNEEFSSRLRLIPFPFKEADKGSAIEIYHGSHGKVETKSPVRTFAPYSIKGDDYVLAAYTCTPLVKIPVAQLKPGEKVTGVTIAELGNQNRPLDMIVYTKDDKDYILMANSSRGLMKISTEGIDKAEGITSRVKDKAGLTYTTLDTKGVQHLAKLDGKNALILRTEGGALNLETLPLP